MRIGELAERAGVSVRSLRYYEEQGLLESERTTGGHREYREPDVARVRFMQMLYAAGMPSRRIIELLPFLDTGVATRTMLDHFDEESDRIRRQIEALGATHDRLARLRDIAAESIAGRPPEECRSSANAAAA
ncbi:MerR family transcriptional regulator [Curtobacterium sp. MCSS17_005]|jgi:DNA-binding transcriptional MerR regulator|uniref:MerR family transcriptional regulator n=1 Tax=Curtobacterium sp. MCSS17_005 TaxID=2175641 RepID=UPI000DA7D50A|nr:MerR family transcriptional regulator [Curtobacterium sp. MCSS17_005]WIB34070.1 MerR family transcriptional regulator [Curtobacterium sp. MCSS17_005]